jgi:CubicO group peptidase (beta-lactamase class C family)
MLLGGAVEKAVGQPLDVYVQARLFGPLGVTTSQWRCSPTGAVMGGGSLALNARDWAKIGQLLLDRGRFGKGQIAPADWVREMVKPHRIVDAETSYGYLVWRRPLRSACGPVDSVFLMGAGGSGVFILPERNMVITELRQDFDQLIMHRRTRAFIESAILPAIPC